ncbi:SusC/RagA family TonB-linked outer membrane protein [Persicitalea jodogahamensis]|uniref:SusC/RagA family TonB-linked outer membrane protein n=1 Tax=Persicitalea jodogahamensis TaxID=402147 RepID=A0A8J3G901_9BACT|nr:TonB-dependent receptor [Persicitalea jodogahamensis]GHB59127.1 SusC/RagA family TonB-linked outer membrane protein [Persicitalea jodogahamensis]
MMKYYGRIWLLCLLLTGISFGVLAQRVITGKVTSVADGSPLPGVSVLVKGTTNGTSADAEGQYRLSIPTSGTVTLAFSFIGLEPQEITVGTNRSVVNVEMAESATELNQVVVTGYNQTQRKDVIGSIASIKSDVYKDVPVVGVDQALQGRAAGVQVSQSSGTPGGGISIRIRGNTSISASNSPLFIVDGVPVQVGAVSGRDFGGQRDNTLAIINPNDIESLEVLKDASAKAIYGSRGANGVVIITTKRGRNNKTTITADVQRGVTQIIKRPQLLNSSQLVELQREAITNAGQDPDKQGIIAGVTDGVDTDWVDAVLRQGILQQYQISAAGGNDRTRFYLSGSVRDEEGVQLNNRFTRYSGALNLDHKATSKLSFGANINMAISKNNRVKGDNFLDGVYSGAIKSLPFYAPFNEQGQLYGPNSIGYAGFPNFNPVAQAVLPRFVTHGLKMIVGVNADYEIIKNLRFRTKFSMDYNNAEEDQYESSGTAIGGFLQGVGGKGYGVYITSTSYTLINSNVLTYYLSLNENHHFNVLLGNEIIHSQGRSSDVTGRLFPSDDFTYINSAGIVDAGGSFFGQNGLLSFFGEVKYDYKDRYLLGFTSRYDGSSRFGQNRRFGLFPSASAGWRISQEKFMENARFISDLKLRGSFGFTGNERIGNFQYLGTWASATYNGATGVGPNNLSNPNLQWERTREANVGFDASFWNGRFSVTADAYSNLTDNLLFAEPIPLTTGFGSIQGNIGQISNRGVELTLSSVNVDREVRWSTDLNLTHNVNNVAMLANQDTLFRGYSGNGVGGTNAVLQGQPLGTFWGLKFMGVDPATGDAIYEDVNGDGRISPEDGQVIGNAQPKLFGGFTNSVSYKGFDLSVFFQFMYGNKILNFTNTSLLNTGSDIQDNQSIAALRRWQQEGDVTDIPRYVLGNTYNSFHSSRFLEDGSYLRLKNISLGYNLPARWVTRAKMGSVRVFASATNLWTLTAYSGPDPEVSTLDGSTTAQGIDFFTLPQVKTIMGGVTVKF